MTHKGVARTIAGSDAWGLIHVMIVFGICSCSEASSPSISRSAGAWQVHWPGPRGRRRRIAIGDVLVILDGVAAKQFGIAE
jgi:hypothetical protein